MKSAELCVVDTSIFVDFFRGEDIPAFERLVYENRVLLSPFVKLELLSGVRRAEEQRLRHVLDGLIELNLEVSLFVTAEKLLAKMRGKGVTIGSVDLLIAAQAHLGGYSLMSRDKIFSKIAAAKLVKMFSE